MGKGDKKTKRGKIILGSYGVRRKRKTNKDAFVKDVTTTKMTKEVEVIEAVEPVEIVAEAKPVKEKKAKETKKDTPAKKKKEAED